MSTSNQTQIDLWNGRVGEKWAALQVSMDQMLAPATAELSKRAGSVAGLRVLDIGCGNGVTCAAWLAGGASVTGVDVSEAMLAVAAARTNGRAELIHADASVWRSETTFDVAVSQFGVMFFADPYAAFANIAANLRPGGRLLFACWRPLSENPWTKIPMGAIRDLLPPVASVDPRAPPPPGPFALGNRSRLLDIASRAGFVDIKVDAVDIDVCFAAEGGVDEAMRLATQIGPAASALAELSGDIKADGAVRIRAALAPFAKNGRVALGGAIWVVDAQRAS
jgi:SAM-dependent methyltransferase